MNIRLEQPEDYREMPKDDEVPFFLAQELIPGYWGDREGTYCPPKGYFVADENPDAFEAYEATFPEKEKLRLPGQLGYEETGRILLRPWQESDAPTLYKYASDPDVGPHAGWPPHKSVEESREVIKNFFSNEDTWAIELKETSEIIGCIGVLRASVSNLKIAENECEIGYWVAKPYWGKGICTEALRLVIDYCFNVNKFNAIWGDYFPENPASGKVMEKCCFIDTGKETICPNLAVGADRPVKVMKLER